jgi:hypothetical protein
MHVVQLNEDPLLQLILELLDTMLLVIYLLRTL